MVSKFNSATAATELLIYLSAMFYGVESSALESRRYILCRPGDWQPGPFRFNHHGHSVDSGLQGEVFLCHGGFSDSAREVALFGGVKWVSAISFYGGIQPAVEGFWRGGRLPIGGLPVVQN